MRILGKDPELALKGKTKTRFSRTGLRSWQSVVSPQDRRVYAITGRGQRRGLGQRPAILVVDVTYAFTGDYPEPILDSIKRYPNSCGISGWISVSAIRKILRMAHSRGVPVIYTAGIEAESRELAGGWAQKSYRMLEPLNVSKSGPENIVKEIAPRPGEYVIAKIRPSAFFGTPLLSYLIQKMVDTLLVTGCTTSGCVRASVTDAFSYNYKIGVIEEAVFDRGEIPHRVNLWDMNAKYADVISLREALTYLRQARLANPVQVNRLNTPSSSSSRTK